MKKLMLLLTVVTMFILGLSSCVAPRVPVYSQTSENNKDYQVDYLFEHDGCKVYRFRDNGNYVYFTNCTGNVTNITSDSTRVETIVKGK